MSSEPNGLYKVGGAAFIASGVLFLSRHVLDMIAGPPPSGGAEILAWVEVGRIPLSLVSEVTFFAVISLVPAVIALYRSLADVAPVRAAIGCGIMAIAIPVLALLLIVHGRLVYPVYGIRVSTPVVAELVVAIFYGGLHAINLLFAVATFVLSLAMIRGAYGAPVAYLGFTTAVLDVLGSYPYAIGPALTFLCQAAFGAWFVAVGWRLHRLGATATGRTKAAGCADRGLLTHPPIGEGSPP